MCFTQIDVSGLHSWWLSGAEITANKKYIILWLSLSFRRNLNSWRLGNARDSSRMTRVGVFWNSIYTMFFCSALCHSVGISTVEGWAMREILPEWQGWVFFAILFFSSWNFITPCCHSVRIWIVGGKSNSLPFLCWAKPK